MTIFAPNIWNMLRSTQKFWNEFFLHNCFEIAMDIFLSIPEEISKQLAFEWLEISDVARLDSSYMSHNSRAKFLGLVADPHSEIVHGTELDFSSLNDNRVFLAWLVKRQCHIRKVRIPVELADDSEHLRRFFEICGSGLKEIKVQLCRYKPDSACASIVTHVTEHCHNLQQLTFNGRGFPENLSLLHQLSLCCPHIHKLTLNSCFEYTGNRNQDLSFLALQTFESFNTPLSDNFLTAIAIGSAHLEELRFVGASNVSGRGFEAIGANCPLFKSVRLEYMDCEDVHILPIVRSCKNLRCLQIVEPLGTFTDVSLAAVALNCLALHTLRLEDCSGITDSGVKEVLRSCTDLRELNLDYNMYLTDETLYSIAKHCSLLTTLSIEGDCDFSDAGLAAVAKECNCLQRVVFSTGGEITQASVGLFSEQVEVVCEEGDCEYFEYDMDDFMDNDYSDNYSDDDSY